jgi:hypothetical protein
MNNPYGPFDTGQPYFDNYNTRWRIQVRIKGKWRITFYSRYLMELHLGRILQSSEQVDHIDGNPMNDVITNLRIVTRSEHRKLHIKRLKSHNFICPYCKKPFSLSGHALTEIMDKINRNPNRSGPYCSNHCARVACAAIRYQKEQFATANILPEYYTLHQGELK